MSILKKYYLKNLRAQIESEIETLVLGGGSSFDEVEKLRGRIAGLKLAESILEETVEDLKKLDSGYLEED